MAAIRPLTRFNQLSGNAWAASTNDRASISIGENKSMSSATPLGSFCIAAVLPLMAACADVSQGSLSAKQRTGSVVATTDGPSALALPTAAEDSAAPAPRSVAERYQDAITVLATEQSAEARALAVGELLWAAEHGHAAAQHRLAEFYWVTAASAEDRARAIGWFERAAHQGDADAAFRMGDATLNGYGVKANGRRAAAWLRKASEDDVAEAQYMLGMIHLAGNGVERDPSEAQRWLGRAAENGHPEAARQLQALLRKAPIARR
jgi:TPR repeat protein